MIRADKSLSLPAAVLGLLSAAVVSVASAQVPTPKLTAVFPAGGQAGTQVQVSLRGADIEDVTELRFSHPGITAALYVPPEGEVPEKPDPKATAKAAPAPKPKKGAVAAKIDPNTWLVTIGKDVPNGLHELRVVGRWGISNPRAFAVSELQEVKEAEPNDTPETAQAIEPETVVNGQSDKPADLDWYKVRLPAGKRVVIQCAAEQIDSRINPLLTLSDPAGKILAVSSAYSGRHALIDFTPPAEAEYRVQVREFTYQGSAVDFVYRLTVSSGPQIEYALPDAVPPGKKTEVTLYGRNLPGGSPAPEAVVNGKPLEKLTVTVEAPADAKPGADLRAGVLRRTSSVAVDGFEYRLATPAGRSNPIVLALAEAPVAVQKAGNHKPEAAQPVAVPCEVCGVLAERARSDFYRFTAKKGEKFRIEAVAARTGSPADLVLMIGGYSTKKAAASKGNENEPGWQYLNEGVDDDPTTVGTGGNGGSVKFDARSEDPRTVFTAPADEDYFIQVKDLYGAERGDGRFRYRLRILPANPDFRVAVMNPEDGPTGGVTLRRGGRTALQVMCGRYDGFAGTVKVVAEGLPAGVTAQPAILGPGSGQAPLILSAAENAEPWAGIVRLVATAEVDGKQVVREVRPAVMLSGNPNDASVPRAVRMTDAVGLAVRETAPYTLSVDKPEAFVSPGGKFEVKVKVARREGFAEAVALVEFQTAVMPSQNQNGKAVGTIAKDADTAAVSFTVPKNTPYGTYTFAVLGSAPFTMSANPKDAKAAKKPQKVMDPSDAITVTVAPPVEVLPPPEGLTAKTGATLELPVKIKRLPGFAEEVKVTLGGARGVSAEPLTIAGKDSEGKLTVKIDPKAPAGAADGLVLTATVKADGASVNATQPVKLTVEKAAEPAPATPAAPAPGEKPDKKKK